MRLAHLHTFYHAIAEAAWRGDDAELLQNAFTLWSSLSGEVGDA